MCPAILSHPGKGQTEALLCAPSPSFVSGRLRDCSSQRRSRVRTISSNLGLEQNLFSWLRILCFQFTCRRASSLLLKLYPEWQPLSVPGSILDPNPFTFPASFPIVLKMESRRSSRGSTHPLHGMEIAIPPRRRSLPPRTCPSMYEAKPLPPIPQRNPLRNLKSAGIQARNYAPDTIPRPLVVKTRRRTGELPAKRPELPLVVDGENEDDAPMEIRALILPKFDTGIVRRATDSELLSPQPRQSVQKVLQLTGLTTPLTNSPVEASPTLHNSPAKIRQLMGHEPDMNYTLQGAYEVSPVTTMSEGSIYSQDIEPSVSEPDLEFDGSDYHATASSVTDHDDDFEDTLRSSKYSSWLLEPPESFQIPPLCIRHRGSESGASMGCGAPKHQPSFYSQNSNGWLRRRSSASQPYVSSRAVRDMYHATSLQIAGRKHDEDEIRVHRRPSTEVMVSPLEPSESRKKRLSFQTGILKSQSRKPAPLKIDEKPSFATGNHPQKTPYPVRSTLDGETAPWRYSESLTKLIKWGFNASRDQDARGKGFSFHKPRRVNSLDTPLLTANNMLQRTNEHLHGLVAQARKTAGLVSKNEKRRESMKDRIRIIPEGTPI
jgi:hypothetical protein